MAELCVGTAGKGVVSDRPIQPRADGVLPVGEQIAVQEGRRQQQGVLVDLGADA